MPKYIDHVVQRRVIASAALRVIDEGGLEGARLRDVAAAASVTTGAVTHYFDGKDALLRAAMDEIVRRILEKQRTLTPARLVDNAARFLPLQDQDSRREWRAWLAFWGRAIADEDLRARHRAYYAEICAVLAEQLCEADPSLAPDEAARHADAVIAAIDGIGARATLEPEDWPASRQIETLAALLQPLAQRLDGMARRQDDDPKTGADKGGS